MKQSYVRESGLHDQIFREMEAKYQKESREKQFAYGFAEFLTVFRKLDGFGLRTDNFHVVFFQNAHVVQIHEQVQRSLSAESRQNGVGPFFNNNFGSHELIHGLDIGCVAESGIRHNGSRVGVQQNNAAAFFFQGFKALRAGIVKFCCLADDNGA